MNYPKFKPGERVCFLAKQKEFPSICSGIVKNCYYNSVWVYDLDGWMSPFNENELMDFTQAFGEYYENISQYFK